MNNDFGYISKTPFKSINQKDCDIAIINSENDGLSIKVINLGKYESFKEFEGPGKLIESKLYYGVNSKNCPITFFNANIKNTVYSPICTSTIFSNMYAIGKCANDSIRHLKPNTRIRKFNYYNDNLIDYFNNNSIQIKKNINMRKTTIQAETTKPLLLFNINYKRKNLKIYLMHTFDGIGNIYDYDIKPCTYLQIVSNKALILDDILQLKSCIDSTLHMCLLIKSRDRLLTLFDFKKCIYKFYNYRIKVDSSKKKSLFSICDDKKEKVNVFEKIMNLFVNVNFENSNTFLPFINFDKEVNYYEIEFLQYYKVLETIDFERQKQNGKSKSKDFLLKYLKKYDLLKQYFFKNEDIIKIEREIRSLRNYYSHEGFYVEKLPIYVGNKIEYYKDIDYQWIYDVKRFVTILAYIEVYNKAGVKIDELKLINYLY